MKTMFSFQINLTNYHRKKRCPIKFLEQKLKNISNGSKKVSINFVDDVLIKKLNRQHLGKNVPTDVLSFDLSEKKFFEGEIIISLDRAQKQSAERGVSFRSELLLLCVHGLLHLSGYTDYSISKRNEMRSKELEALFKSMENV